MEPETRNEVASKMTYYAGLSKEEILQNNLEVPFRFFWKELLHKNGGTTIGRLDFRYLGIDRRESGDSPDYNAELTFWLHSFTPAINYYLDQEPNFKTDLIYYMFGPVHFWDQSGDNTCENLRQAMARIRTLM